MGKLESLELPDAVAAVAMLHDMPPEQRAAHMPSLPHTTSALESMQSIEQVGTPPPSLPGAPGTQNNLLDAIF